MWRRWLQSFREFRAVYEQQRSVLEQRYRALVEDAVQDAIFLASRNDTLQHDNDSLRQRESY
jgi:enamine deaminase RidA (YjgF/YER057c/UK114 family)